MIINEFKLRSKNAASCTLQWRSSTATMVSWIFVNGKLVLGPFMPGTVDRSLTIPFPQGMTGVVEIHDFDNIERIPDAAIEILPQIQPLISWNTVDDAERYNLYYDAASQSLLRDYPNRQGLERQEVKCPITLDGKHGKWHLFHVESVDKYNNESPNEGERIVFWAYDLPVAPDVTVQKNQNGLYDFIVSES
ncbi:MAG: hypothetical protein LBQ66_13020 [Planctomycetaceae bacterium]|jgi:hypothetical protein|nr:hypothetical protein [Planctomycetaceae bacterium]